MTAPGRDLGATGDLLAAYRERLDAPTTDPNHLRGPRGTDEVVTAEGVRDEQGLIATAIATLGLPGLRQAADEARRLVQDDAIRYGTAPGADTADHSGELPGTALAGRNWVIDPLPVVVGADEWARLQTGLQQRARLLDLVLTDLYGERTLLRQGLIAPEIVFGHAGFLHQVDGIRLIGERQLLISSTDLARGSDGAWFAVADRTAVPSGAGYTMATRRITSQVMAGLHRRAGLTRMRGYFHTMAAALLEVAGAGEDNPKGAVLSPGPGSETGFEHGFIATLLGFALVEAEDLAVRDGRMWITSGERQAHVDVLLRRVDSAFADPLELRPDSRLGVAGLIEATRRGTLAVVNPMGAGVLENPALLARMPQLARELLGEDLVLPSAPTWWCGDAGERAHVLAHLDELVIKPISRGVEHPTVCGWQLDAAARAELRARIAARPWAWCGQDPVAGSTAPVVTAGGLEPRRFVLRSFGVHRAGEYHFLPGGLGRVAPQPDDFLVSNTAGALAKDVWVLAPDEGAPAPWAYERSSELRRMPVGTRPAVLAPRVAADLFWVGRYTERVEGTARLLRITDDLVEDYAGRPNTPGAQVMSALLTAVRRTCGTGSRVGSLDVAPVDELRSAVADLRPGTIAYAVRRLAGAAQGVRDQLSYDTWHVLARLERILTDTPQRDSQLQTQLYDILESTLAMAGVVAESMMRDTTWAFIEAGMRIERAQSVVSLLRATLTVDRPPAVDGQVAEAVLQVGESIITHRRRLVSGEGPARPAQSALALLLLDSANPRSVAFVLERLTQALEQIGDRDLLGECDGLAQLLSGMDLDASTEGDRHALGEVLDQAEAGLRRVSDELTRRHFRRRAAQHTMPSDWSALVQHSARSAPVR